MMLPIRCFPRRHRRRSVASPLCLPHRWKPRNSSRRALFRVVFDVTRKDDGLEVKENDNRIARQYVVPGLERR